MTRDRLVVWLARHPMVAVCVSLVLVALFSASIAMLVRTPPPPTFSSTANETQVAPDTLPTPTQRPPEDRVDAAHEALHELQRGCEIPMRERPVKAIRDPLEEIESFAKDFPSGGFAIDGAPGTTLALLIVVWNEVQACDPSYVPGLQELIPAEYRGG